MIDPHSIPGEPAGDVHAQIAAVRDPRSRKDTALVVPNSKGRFDTRGLLTVPTRQGLLITSNQDKAAQAHPDLSTEEVGGLLGYVTPKAETDGTLVQAIDPSGAVIHEEATNAAMLPQAYAQAQSMLPGAGSVQVTDGLSAQLRRFSEGNGMNGMGGGLDPQMLQMLMKMQGGGGMGMGGSAQQQSMPTLVPPVQNEPPPTANLGLPTGMQLPQGMQMQGSPLGQNFGQWQQQPTGGGGNWLQNNQQGMQNALQMLMKSGLL